MRNLGIITCHKCAIEKFIIWNIFLHILMIQPSGPLINVECLEFNYLAKICTMIFNFKFIPYFNILQNFVENVRKKNNSILSWPWNIYRLKETLFAARIILFWGQSFMVAMVTEWEPLQETRSFNTF